MDETFPYIKTRIELLKLRGVQYEPELSRSKDKTTHVVKEWHYILTSETKLRHETLKCITFSTKGKIEVHDALTLERLNTQIESLYSRRSKLESIFEKLSKDAPEFLSDLRKQQREAEKVIKHATEAPPYQLGVELQQFQAPSLETAMRSHRYLAVVKQSNHRIASAKVTLADIEPKIALIQELLASAAPKPARTTGDANDGDIASPIAGEA